MKLTSENVDNIVKKCLAQKREEIDIIVDGIVNKYGYKKEFLEANRDDICSLLRELPNEFFKAPEGGGGWTFLNACNDKHGNQWTSFHMKMEALFCLGMGLGIVKYCMPREMWGAFPGGMPYLEIDLVRDEITQ